VKRRDDRVSVLLVIVVAAAACMLVYLMGRIGPYIELWRRAL